MEEKRQWEATKAAKGGEVGRERPSVGGRASWRGGTEIGLAGSKWAAKKVCLQSGLFMKYHSLTALLSSATSVVSDEGFES